MCERNYREERGSYKPQLDGAYMFLLISSKLVPAS